MRHIQWPYDVDPTGEGFFCPKLKQKRLDYFALKIFRPSEAESVYQCRPGARVGSIFVEDDFRYYDAPIGLELGLRNPIVARWLAGTNGIVAQGWDTAMSASSSADYSVCVTILMVPCESFHRDMERTLLVDCDQHYDIYVLDVFRDKLDIGDLTLAVREQAKRWEPQRVIIEKKASGASVMQAVANYGLPIEGVAATESKRERAVNGGAGAGSVQGWFRAGRVLFPKMPEPLYVAWLDTFVRELKDFSGEKGAVDDQVDALVHVANYAIREGSVAVQFPEGWRTEADIDTNMRAGGGLADVFAGLVSPEVSELLRNGVIEDPFNNRCGRCRNFNPKKSPSCPVHKMNVTAVNPACDRFDDGSRTLFAT